MAAGHVYKFAFGVVNPDSAQTAPALSVSASGSTTISNEAVNGDRLRRPNVLEAIPGDAAPLKVDAPALHFREIAQSRASPGESVTVTVTLASNVDLVAGDAISLVGLTGTQTGDAGGLALQGLRVLLDSGDAGHSLSISR